MKLRTALVLFASAALAACGSKPQGKVRFSGYTPNNAIQKDTRSVSFSCGGCGQSVTPDAEACPDQKKCKARLAYSDKYSCGYCTGSGICAACVMMEQAGGECYNCKGVGHNIYVGKAVVCPGCKGEKKCSACKGSRKCDWCKEGKIEIADIKERAKKAAGAAPKPEDPKPEEKKP